jgi:hypothetical protein
MTISAATNRFAVPLTILTSLLLISLTGCSATRYGAANIDSSPQGAEIINLKDNTNLGQTPAQVVWRGEQSEKVTVQLQKRGYRSAITSFWINKRHGSEAEARTQAIDVHTELEQE